MPATQTVMPIRRQVETNIGATPETMLTLFRSMLRIRRFEERVTELFKAGMVKGTAHSYIGEEAIAAGACAPCADDDYIASYHRGHGHCIAKGAQHRPDDGRADGPRDRLLQRPRRLDAHRRPRAQHPGRQRHRRRGHAALARRGAGRQAAGAATGGRSRSSATAPPTRASSTNRSISRSVWKLPVVFVCENNQYALSTAFRKTTSVDRSPRARAPTAFPG